MFDLDEVEDDLSYKDLSNLLPGAHEELGGGNPHESLAPHQPPHASSSDLLLVRGVLERRLGLLFPRPVEDEEGVQEAILQPSRVERTSGAVDERGDPEARLMPCHPPTLSVSVCNNIQQDLQLNCIIC